MPIALVMACVTGTAGDLLANGDQRTREYEIKAAFVYNLLKFVEWPAATPSTGPLNITLVT